MTTGLTTVTPPSPSPTRPSGPPGPRDPCFLTEVRRRYPETVIWRGWRTGSWWAFHPFLSHLVEAASPSELAPLLHAALRTAAPRRADGAWAALPR